MSEPTVLLDSNLLIYAVKPAYESVRQLIRLYQCAASAISLVEVLGYQNFMAKDIEDYQQLFTGLIVLQISPVIIDRAVALRQQRRMKLGDVLIAATAIEHNLKLATNDEDHFRWISDIRLINPLTNKDSKQ